MLHAPISIFSKATASSVRFAIIFCWSLLLHLETRIPFKTGTHVQHAALQQDRHIYAIQRVVLYSRIKKIKELTEQKAFLIRELLNSLKATMSIRSPFDALAFGATRM